MRSSGGTHRRDRSKAAVYLSNLGGALWDRSRLTGDPDDRAAAIDVLRRDAPAAGAPAIERATAAEAAARLSADGGDWVAAPAYWHEAFEQLPQLVGVALGAGDREHTSSGWVRLPGRPQRGNSATTGRPYGCSKPDEA